ncbi:MAG: aminotransferase class I/II-fold pyridoxal phosphate-dependent enzyme [Actinomycetia bacterium]|nr:aminotransferase class I/II-fold pyridoxal phosphate-dependent enzyme [Actinomycetes bacterium]
MALLVDEQTGAFAGLMTDGDVRRALLAGMGLESSVEHVERKSPIVAKAGTPLHEIAGMFSEKLRFVPLLDDKGEVVDLAVLDRRMRLPVAEPMLGERELEYVTECILTGWISSAGRFVTRLEEQFAAFCQTRFGVATSSGTTALHLALLALNIGPGDEVIVPSLSFIATANAVAYTGAKPVFVDIEADSWNLDPGALEAAITPLTKALLPVHLYGHPANMDPILEIARRHNLYVVEDAAESPGARYKGRPVGGLSDIAIFSFYGNKIVTTGEGGMVVTNNEEVAERVRLLRDHGMSKVRRYWHPVLGYNYRMTNLQAAVGVAQMEKVERILETKARLAATYDSLFKDIPGITCPPQAEWASPVCWLYTLLVDERIFGESRDTFIRTLQQHNVESRPAFPPIHKQPLYEAGITLPVAERVSNQGVSLPSAVSLTHADIERIVSVIRAMRD